MQTRIMSAELLLVGTELTTGVTRDSNGSELAAELSRRGVAVTRLVELPDDLDAVTGAVREAQTRADLVVTSGGLGPTPDDLTREAIAAACGLTPFVDAELERWLLALFERRGIAMPEVNRKQAWLITGAVPLRNDEGTAPGWWVERPDGRLIVALPGPPREMRAIWRNEVLPRLESLGMGVDVAVRTLRLTDIGESHVAELLGESLLRAPNPIVATYARPDAVDVRISARVPVGDASAGSARAATSSPPVATGGSPDEGLTAADLVAGAEQVVRGRLGRHIFAVDEETWVDALGARLAGRRLATLEIGTGGALASLLGGSDWLVYAEVRPDGWLAPGEPSTDEGLAGHARRVRRRAGADVGLAILARPGGTDTEVRVSVAAGRGAHAERRTVFRTGDQGRRRAALAACSVLWRALAEGAASG